MTVATHRLKVERPFQGIRVVVNAAASFDEVTDRLRALMGKASVGEIIALAKEPMGEEQFEQIVTSRFVGESEFTLFAEIDKGEGAIAGGVHVGLVGHGNGCPRRS